MEVGNAFKVEITQLKISKPLLKFMARNVNSQTTKFLQNLKACYNEAPRTFEVELGGLYVACISQTQFERCRVLQANEVDKIALVVLIDCGYQGTLRYAQVKCYGPLVSNLKSLFLVEKRKFPEHQNVEASVAGIYIGKRPANSWCRLYRWHRQGARHDRRQTSPNDCEGKGEWLSFFWQNISKGIFTDCNRLACRSVDRRLVLGERAHPSRSRSD